MIDTASLLREEIYTAIRSITCATVAESEEAARVIIRLVNNATPDNKKTLSSGR